MALRDEIAEIAAEAYDEWANMDTYALSELTDKIADRFLALPAIKRALDITRDYDAAKLGHDIRSDADGS